MMHVSMMISYATLIVGSLFSIYIWPLIALIKIVKNFIDRLYFSGSTISMKRIRNFYYKQWIWSYRIIG